MKCKGSKLPASFIMGFEFSPASCGYYFLQIDVVKSFNDSDGPQWKHSFFGNPNDPETFRFVSGLIVSS